MDFEIEKNVPVPTKKKGLGRWQKLLAEMDVGDAVTFQDDTELTLYHGLRRAAKGMGFKAVMRTLDDGKIKVWKLDAEATAE